MLAARLKATVAGHDASSCTAALHEVIAFYRDLRAQLAEPRLERRDRAGRAAVDYLASTCRFS